MLSSVTLHGVLGLDVDLLHSGPAGPGLHKYLLCRKEPSKTWCIEHAHEVINELGKARSITAMAGCNALPCPGSHAARARQVCYGRLIRKK